MKPKNSKLGIFLVVVAFLLIGYSLSTILRETRLLQYAVPADSTLLDQTQEEGGVLSMLGLRRDALLDNDESVATLQNTTTAFTLDATAPAVPISAKETGAGGSTLAGLIGAGENHFAVYPRIPLLGRVLNPDELKLGDRVAVIDESLSIALFSRVEVIDWEIVIGGQDYRIVGVLRHEKQVGDDADYYCYVPYNALAKQSGQQMQTLLLTAVPAPKGGAMASFKELTAGWIPGGDAYDLAREKTGAWIWARYLMVGLGFAVWGLLLGAFIRWVQAMFAGLRERLSRSYMTRVWPWLLLQILLRLLALAALGAAAAGLLLFLLNDPINAFPEYVPNVLVEPADIISTFWKLRASDAVRVTYATPEVSRLVYFASVIKSAVVLMLAGLALVFFRRSRSRGVKA